MSKYSPWRRRAERVLASKSKRWLKKALVSSSILRLASRLTPPSAAILAYHSIAEKPQLTDHIFGASTSKAQFEKHMKTLARKFRPVSLEEVVQFAKSGRQLPPGAVTVTFDDGFADNYDVALPILNRYGIPASFYIMVNAVENGTLPWYCRLRFTFHATNKREWKDSASGRAFRLDVPEERKAALNLAWDTGAKLTGSVQERFIGGVEESLGTEPANGPHGFMMTWEQVRGLRRAGHTVGAHTLSHPNVAQVSSCEARAEIVESKRHLQERIGEAIEHFSYPHPALNPCWSSETLEITREAGYKSAVLTTPGQVRAGDEPLALKRANTPSDLVQFTLNLQRTFAGR
jgi:peptidoglycan/xylan/chitin deacetylase (PgdA/CDA1 family)